MLATDTVALLSKENGTFPEPLQGHYPAIAVSYAATIEMEESHFAPNFGHSMQYANKAERDTWPVGQRVLEEDPEEYAQDVVQSCVEFVDRRPNAKQLFIFDCTALQGHHEMLNHQVERRRQEIAEVEEKRIKGSVKIASYCKFRNNGLSPYFPRIPNGLLDDVEPWLSRGIKLMELMDEENGLEQLEAYNVHDDARRGRDVWEDFTEELQALKVFNSLVYDEALTGMLVDSFKCIDHWSDPQILI